MRLVRVVSETDWPEAEAAEVLRQIGLGNRLCNMLPGGNGAVSTDKSCRQRVERVRRLLLRRIVRPVLDKIDDYDPASSLVDNELANAANMYLNRAFILQNLSALETGLAMMRRSKVLIAKREPIPFGPQTALHQMHLRYEIRNGDAEKVLARFRTDEELRFLIPKRKSARAA